MNRDRTHGTRRGATAIGRLPKALVCTLAVSATWMASAVLPAGAGAAAGPGTATWTASLDSDFNNPGNILIADQFNNRVIEIDHHRRIVWQYGLGPTDFSPRSIVGVNDAQRVGPLTLMAGTGTPPGVVPTCTDANGCPDDRVILVEPHGRIVWQYGTFGVAGSGPDELNTPVQSTWLPNAHVLITDQANERVIEVDLAKRIVWQYGMTGVTGDGPNQLNNPNSAELLANGHILIADENNNRAIEVTRDHKIVATFSAAGTVSGMAFASRLPNGHTLLTDANKARDEEWCRILNVDEASEQDPALARGTRLRSPGGYATLTPPP